MINDIAHPAAHALVTWVASEMGGRASGLPTAPVYAATAVFVHGGDAEVEPDWPVGADQLSILIQMTETLPGGAWLCKIDFLARELAAPLVRPGVVLLIMEGQKVVATAVITALTRPGSVEDLVRRAASLDHCVVRPPSGEPVIEPSQLT